MSLRGQTWIEFIVATTIFLFMAGFLFFYASGHAREEAGKVIFQTNCMKTDSLHKLIKQTGEPVNWDSSGSVNVFGLSNGSSVKYSKWLKAKSIGYGNISANSTPEPPWRISYLVYAFEPGSDSVCAFGDAVTLCRESGKINITANSTSDVRTELVLFFPFSSASISYSDADNSNAANGNGTEVSLIMLTNSSDQDFTNITFSPDPKFIFIKKFAVSGGQEMSFLLGNKTLADSFGPKTESPQGLCAKKAKAVISFGSEQALANFDLESW